MRYIFIVNSNTKDKEKKQVINNIEKVCKERNIEHIIEYTTYPKEAIEIASKYKDSDNVIFGVGGDRYFKRNTKRSNGRKGRH